jgi:asparagine synthase (glutamine-hydrolysing)
MIRSMEHQEFYTSGTFCAPGFGFYGGWTTHNGVAPGRPVFLNEREDVALLLSGECVADRGTRAVLRRKGHEFGEGIAQWLVHSYEEEGDNFFGLLNGLFSGVLIDKRRGIVFLFNDRYGIDRIYWTERPDGVYFASEAKALLRALPELRNFDEEGVADFLLFGCTLDWKTLFRNVHVLPGGSLWSFEGKECKRARYFNVRDWEGLEPLSSETFQAELEEKFASRLPLYFEGESRIGISLTGGLDSRMIMACSPGTRRKPVCYTFAGVTGNSLDVRLAARVAAACGLEHRVIRLDRTFFENFASYADGTVYATDGNFGVAGAHEIYFNARARAVAPVRVTGVFGSEVLRAVSMFSPDALSPGLVDAGLTMPLLAAMRQDPGSAYRPATFSAFREIPWVGFGTVKACRSQVAFRTPYLDNELVALACRCPEEVRTSTRSGLQVVKKQHPALAGIPTDRRYGSIGHVVAEAMFKLDYLANEGLPHFLSPVDFMIDRILAGIGMRGCYQYLNYRRWFRRELSEYLRGRLAEARRCAFWNRPVLDRLADDHIHGRRNYIHEITAVLTLEAVDRLLIRGWSGDAAAAASPEPENVQEFVTR